MLLFFFTYVDPTWVIFYLNNRSIIIMIIIFGHCKKIFNILFLEYFFLLYKIGRGQTQLLILK